MLYRVPILNGSIPIASEIAYLAYKNMNHMAFHKDYTSQFKPIVQIGTGINS